MSESEIIARIRGRLVGMEDPDVLIGVGDDAAVVRAPTDPLIISTDTIVEGVHVDLSLSSPADAGFKAVTSAVSDMAAMGARARWVVVASVLPARMLAVAGAIAEGLDEGARASGVAIVGGDTSDGETFSLTVTVIGTAERPLLRTGARSGDVLCVTGMLGAAATGLALLRATAAGDPRADALLRAHPGLAGAHRRPRARVAEGAALAAVGARAMIDLSDGLGSDAPRLLGGDVSGVTIDRAALPLADGVVDASGILGVDPAITAVAGGEDYELAIALAPADIEVARAAIAPTPLTVIGSFDDGDGARWSDGGALPRGWEHFA